MSKSDNGRDSKGRFADGNSGGPGRPKRQTEVTYLIAMSEVIGLNDWVAIVEKAKEQAVEGDDKARRWIAEYVIGKSTSLAQAIVYVEAGHDGTQNARLDIMGHAVRGDAETEYVESLMSEAHRERRAQEPKKT